MKSIIVLILSTSLFSSALLANDCSEYKKEYRVSKSNYQNAEENMDNWKEIYQDSRGVAYASTALGVVSGVVAGGIALVSNAKTVAAIYSFVPGLAMSLPVAESVSNALVLATMLAEFSGPALYPTGHLMVGLFTEDGTPYSDENGDDVILDMNDLAEVEKELVEMQEKHILAKEKLPKLSMTLKERILDGLSYGHNEKKMYKAYYNWYEHNAKIQNSKRFY